MATISSPGIGSGLDVTSLVTQLVAAEKAPQQDQIDTHRSQVTSQISALGTLTSSLAAIQAALKGLSDGTAFADFIATTSTTGVLGATADSTASTGTYQVNVEQLATAAKASSAAFATGSTFSSGTLTIAVGTKSLSIDVGSGINSLSALADSINRSAQNPGVAAAVVHANDGDHLVLTSTTTGAENAFTVSGTGDVAGLSYDPANGVNGLSTVTSAQDAKLTIDGFEVDSATNQVQGAIKGVTLNLSQLSAGTPTTLTIAADNSSIASTIKALVTSYNNFVTTSKSLTSYDASTKTAGALLGDSTLLGIQNQLARQLGAVVGSDGSSIRSLADIGISFQVDGSLSLDSDKLGTALAADPTQVKNLFGSSQGLAQSLNPYLDNYLSSTGILAGRTQGLNDSSKSLDDQQTQLDARMQDLTTMYQTQFTALDTLLTSLKSTSSFLTQQLSALPAAGSSS